MTADPGTGVAIVSLGIAAWSLIRSHLRDTRGDTKEITDKLRADLEKLTEGHGELRNDVKVLKLQMEVFWRGVGVTAAQALHTPHSENARRDYLIDQYVAHTLSAAELEEFRQILRQIQTDVAKPVGERLSAGQVLTVLQLEFPT